MEREQMEFDVLIVGAGPAGLATACRLKQLNAELAIAVVEKGSEVGAHILSGAVIDPIALNELFPDWKQQGAPLETQVQKDEIYLLTSDQTSTKIPEWMAPKSLHNQGNYIISLGNLTRWLATQAEELGVDIFPGFTGAEITYDTDGKVTGVCTGDMGIGRDKMPKDSYMQGMALTAKYTVFSEGCRGHLGKELIRHFNLDKDQDPQHYAIGLKELWQIDPEHHQPGLVIHGSGWPLDKSTNGGFFLYHGDNHQISVGLIVDLNYSNPWLNPYEEFQRLKHHPVLAQYLRNGSRVSYGARAIAKGGFNSLPKMFFPGGLLIGCDAGTLNVSRIKGSHTAMKSGMLAAEAIHSALLNNHKELSEYDELFKNSWLYDELYGSRNFGPALHKYGNWFGGAFNTLDQNFLGGKLPVTLHDRLEDNAQLKEVSQVEKINYPSPDGVLSFDKLSSVYLSNTNHEEDQPCHLQLSKEEIPTKINIPLYSEPAQRYCPAGVYELVEKNNELQLQINAQNCLHCKTCDIKDPCQNIQWTPPEGGGGPNYPNM
ncbi:electron transfer flavoprotein-ubiquinone oxidoreductase [Sessilibacter sp. MAH1]